jgi:hypothetical protein
MLKSQRSSCVVIDCAIGLDHRSIAPPGMPRLQSIVLLSASSTAPGAGAGHSRFIAAACINIVVPVPSTQSVLSRTHTLRVSDASSERLGERTYLAGLAR